MMETRETFDEAVCILFAAHKLAMEHGYYFHEDPRTLADLVDRAYKRYTDLDIDMEMADDYMHCPQNHRYHPSSCTAYLHLYNPHRRNLPVPTAFHRGLL